MFGTILLLIAAVMHAYVFWRISSIDIVHRFVSGRTLFILAVLLWLLVVAGREYGHSNSGALAAFLELLGMNWLVVVFLAFSLLLVADVLTGFGLLFPRLAVGLRLLALGGCVVLSAAALVQGTRAPVVEEYELGIAGLPDDMDGKVIVGMSDLHVGSALGGNWLGARVEQVMERKPDLVVLLGDIFEGHDLPEDAFMSVLGRLSAPLGVWAVQGNHERYGRWEPVKQMLGRAGIGVLENEWVEISPGFVLAGVKDVPLGRPGDPVQAALDGRPPGATVLLSHSPIRVEEAAGAGVDLMLSGHTHAGQVWPFSYIVRIQYPFFQGLYDVDGMKVIVTRGTGTWGPRMRLFSPGEILRITLRKG